MRRVLFFVSLLFLLPHAMKKLLYTLLFIQLQVFAQGQVDCSLLSVTDLIIQNESITFEIYNADTMDTHYPYVAYTLDANGDTIQNGQMNWYVTFAGDTSQYQYDHNIEFDPLVLPSLEYPVFIFFTYSNLTGQGPDVYTCQMPYNPQMQIIRAQTNQERVRIKTIDLFGREVDQSTYKILLDIYDDGSTYKRIIIK